MKRLLLLLLSTHVFFNLPAQTVSCDSFCITAITLDSSNSNFHISISLAGDSSLFINYPYVSAITVDNGDTIATGAMNFFGQFGSTTQTYGASTALDSVPITATVYFRYDTTFCALPYPCNPPPCAFTPVITGDILLCPNEQGTLTTQVYENYQWYKRDFFGTAQPISGATGQTLALDQFNDVGYYFSVEATDSGCTEMSEEVLVDGYVFLLPVVSTTGTFTTGINGETILCEGDTAFFELLSPYDTLITWFESGSAIDGATGSVFAATDSGFYTVEGAPSICPNFIQPLGVTLVVQVEECPTSINRPAANAVQCFWSSGENMLHVQNIPAGLHTMEIALYTTEGKMVMKEKIAVESSATHISLTGIPGGTYICSILLDKDSPAIARKVTIIR